MNSENVAVELIDEGWLARRLGLVTASNAHKLLSKGLDYALRANTLDEFHNFYTNWGHEYEPIARRCYEYEFNTEVLHGIFVTNKLYPMAGCSPDGIDLNGDGEGESILIEIKCFQQEKHDSINEEADLLNYPEIMAQIQFELLILELKRARLILYHPESGLKMVEIGRNEKIIQNIKSKLSTGK